MKKLMTPPGNAAAPQKDESEKFVFKPGTWAWKRFKTKAKWLTKANHFTYKEATLMEGDALGKLLEVDFTTTAKGVDDPEGYVYRAIDNALTNAAQKVADDRRVWGASRLSLDATTGEGEDSRTFGELITAHGDLNRQRKSMGIPRPIAYRWALNRNKRNEAATRKILQRLVEDVSVMLESDLSGEVPEEDRSLAPLEELTADEEAELIRTDIIAGAPEDLNRIVFDPAKHHRQAVAEVGFFESDEDWTPQTRHSSSPMGFGSTSEELYEQILRIDVALVIDKLEDEKDKAWCRRVLEGWDPVCAYKFDRIKKNDYYRQMLPRLRKAFAALKYAIGKGRN